MTKTTLLLLFLSLSFLISCDKKNESGIYENCCGAESVTDTVNMSLTWPDGQGGTFDTMIVGRIFIPNIFTPSDDSNIDSRYYMPFANEGIIRIVSAKYTDNNGGVLFSRANFQPNDIGFSWLGKNTDGSFYKGGFNYEIKVEYIDATVKSFSGKACAYPCGDGGFPKSRLPDCFFPNQNNGYGAPDPTLPQPYGCFN